MNETLSPCPPEYMLEGLDGAGKTTHLARLADDLESLGLRVFLVSSPSRKPNSLGPILRRNIGSIGPERATELFGYDIRRTRRIIPPNTDVVLWDRGIDSVRVSNQDPQEAEKILVRHKLNLHPPTRTIFIDISPEISWERERAASDHPIDEKWIREKYERYRFLLQQDPNQYHVIDGTKPIDMVYDEIRQFIERELSERIQSQQEIHSTLLNSPYLVRFVLDNPVEVKPGIYLPMFINLKAPMGDIQTRTAITERLINLAIKGNYDSIMGLESGGSYYAVTLANQLGIPVAFHRTKEKSYSGANGDIVGRAPKPGSRVLLIDDVYATGQSASRAAKRMQELGCDPELLTVFSYSSDGEMADRLGINATSLTYFKGIRTLALARGLLTEEQAVKLTELVDKYRNTVYE